MMSSRILVSTRTVVSASAAAFASPVFAGAEGAAFAAGAEAAGFAAGAGLLSAAFAASVAFE